MAPPRHARREATRLGFRAVALGLGPSAVGPGPTADLSTRRSRPSPAANQKRITQRRGDTFVFSTVEPGKLTSPPSWAAWVSG